MKLFKTVQDKINQYGVLLVNKEDSKLMRMIDKVLYPLLRGRFLTDFWTTLRFPGGKPTIYFPTRFTVEESPTWVNDVLEHELVHVKDFAPWYGPLWMGILFFLIPFPILFSGRWFIEREAFLVSIKLAISNGWETNMAIDIETELLWNSYLFPWPRLLMRKWFLKKLNENK